MAWNVSILLLWIVLLKGVSGFSYRSRSAGFNPSSLDCTSERISLPPETAPQTVFQSFFSGLYFWKRGSALLVQVPQLPALQRFQSFFSGLYFWKSPSWKANACRTYVSILLLWIVLLKGIKLYKSLTLSTCFNPSSLDCTSERKPGRANEGIAPTFQSFFSGLYFWKTPIL